MIELLNVAPVTTGASATYRVPGPMLTTALIQHRGVINGTARVFLTVKKLIFT